MTPHTTDTSRQNDDLDARIRRIRDKILDGIDETLDDLAQPRALNGAIERQVEHIVRARCAALLCHHALCRRGKRCCRQPCKVPSSAFDRETGM